MEPTCQKIAVFVIFIPLLHKSCKPQDVKIFQEYCFLWSVQADQYLLKLKVRLKIALFYDDVAWNDLNMDILALKIGALRHA